MNEKRGVGFPNSRGQVTIFIILALIIVGASALTYFLYPSIKSTFIGITDPQGFIQTCMQDKIQNTIRNLSVQGGSMSPQNYFPYYNDNLNKPYSSGLYHVEYLCFTDKYYLPCIMQQPLLQSHIEDEIKNDIKQTANSCFTQLQNSFEKKGYNVNFVAGDTVVDILPQRTVITFNDKLTLTKDTTQRFENFSVSVNNNLYELIGIANSILSWESTYGDAPLQTYMNYYHNLIITQNNVGSANDPNLNGRDTDGTKVYIITDINTGEVFQFATRGFAWPPGY
jgi:hypothetical protein